MNPLAFIVSTIFLLVTAGWQLTLYYHAACFFVRNFTPYYILIVAWIGPLIYWDWGNFWWYELFLAQALFLIVSVDNSEKGYKEGTLEKGEAEAAFLFAERIANILALIAFIGGIYTLFK